MERESMGEREKIKGEGEKKGERKTERKGSGREKQA